MTGRGRFGGILILGDMPHVKDTKAWEHRGPLLDAFLEDAGLWSYPIWKTNVCPRVMEEPTIKEIRSLRSRLDRELSQVKPVCIISMGTLASQAMADSHTATPHKYRGRKLVYGGVPVFFTYHPENVLSDRGLRKHLEEDLKHAASWIAEGCPVGSPDKEDYHILPLEDLSKGPSVERGAVDIETGGLDPYSGGRIKSIAVAVSTQAVFYLYCDCVPHSPEWLQTLEQIKKVDCMVFHNAPFDLAWMTLGLPKKHWLWKNIFRDSMITLQSVDEHYRNTSLLHLSGVYCKHPKFETPEFIKQGFPKGWESEENHKTLESYNCRDALCTFELEEVLESKLEERVKQAYHWVCEGIPDVVKMRHAGLALDTKVLEELHTLASKRMKFLEQKLQLAGVEWTSNKKLGEYLYVKRKLPILKKTEGGSASVDADTLQRLHEGGHDKSGFLSRLLKWREYAKIRDTYCGKLRSWGTLAHPQVNLSRREENGHSSGANTGRVTTEFFGTLPRAEKDSEDGPVSPYAVVKRVVVSRYGKKGVIVQADGSQMEMRVLADLSRDPLMMQAFETGEDLHRFVASKIYQIPKEEVSNGQRQVGKHYSFRTVYGGGSLESARKAGAEITEDEDTQLTSVYFKRFTGVASFIDRSYENALQSKKVYSPIGRCFHLDNAMSKYSKDVRKSTNSPIQSAANDFTTEALKQVQAWIERMEYRAHVILTVYDSIIVDWHKDDWAKVDQDYMLRVVMTNKVKARFKQLGWDIVVPIEWDLKIGPSLGECE